ncbi:hypothetical protein [Pseudarcicella hirudinis]|nr:hypothetical protein [Pseudarcicella hirudinis]
MIFLQAGTFSFWQGFSKMAGLEISHKTCNFPDYEEVRRQTT